MTCPIGNRAETLAPRCKESDSAQLPQGLQTVIDPSETPPTGTEPYVRKRRLDVEPAAFALALIAVVASISLWKPLPSAEQFAPAEAVRTVAQAPSP